MDMFGLFLPDNNLSHPDSLSDMSTEFKNIADESWIHLLPEYERPGHPPIRTWGPTTIGSGTVTGQARASLVRTRPRRPGSQNFEIYDDTYVGVTYGICEDEHGHEHVDGRCTRRCIRAPVANVMRVWALSDEELQEQYRRAVKFFNAIAALRRRYGLPDPPSCIYREEYLPRWGKIMYRVGFAWGVGFGRELRHPELPEAVLRFIRGACASAEHRTILHHFITVPPPPTRDSMTLELGDRRGMMERYLAYYANQEQYAVNSCWSGLHHQESTLMNDVFEPYEQYFTTNIIRPGTDQLEALEEVVDLPFQVLTLDAPTLEPVGRGLFA